jgi:predicted PurR-regulated permease PerM
MLGSYIRAQLILASLTLVVYTLVLSILHLRYALILGPLAGISEFIPVVGPAIAAIIVFVIAVLTSYPHLIWLVLFLAIWRLLQDYVNAPRIMGKSLEISPLVQILAVLAGGEIAGVVGALISVPAVATLRILWKRLTSEKEADAPITPIPGEKSRR